MAKPEKVRSSGAALTVDGVQMKRVQSLSTDVDITRDQVLELANSGVVQFVEQSPVITVSVDTNEYGTVDNILLLAGKLITKTNDSNFDDERHGYYFSKIKTPNIGQVTEQDMLDGYATLTVPILEDQSSTTVARTMVIPRAAITGYALNYDVGGIATENFTLQANDKYWYFNDWRDVRVFKLTNYHVGHSAASGAQSAYMMEDALGSYNDGTSQAFTFLGSALGASSYNGSGDYGDGTNIDNLEAVAMIINDKVFRSTAGGNGPWTFDTYPTLNGGSIAMGVQGNLPSGFSTPYAVEGDDVWLVFNPETNQTWPGAAATDSANPGYALQSTAGSYGGASKGFMTGYLFNLEGPSGEVTTAGAAKSLRIQTIAIDLSFTTDRNVDEIYDNISGPGVRGITWTQKDIIHLRTYEPCLSTFYNNYLEQQNS